MVLQVLITCARSQTLHTPTHIRTLTLHTIVLREAFNMNVVVIKLTYFIITGNNSALTMYTFYDKAVQTDQNRS